MQNVSKKMYYIFNIVFEERKSSKSVISGGQVSQRLCQVLRIV